MNILFLTLLDFESINERNIYTDLLREFVKNDHFVAIVSPFERKSQKKRKIIHGYNSSILKIKIGNIQKTNLIEKGLSTIFLERAFKVGIKKYFSDIKFDLVIYSTPPITFQKAVIYAKERDNAKTYLLLKDIFPQNAVDMKMFRKKGLTSILYRYFRYKEKKLYKISDRIGCMSQANCEFLMKNNPKIDKEKIEVCPNSIEVQDFRINNAKRDDIRTKYEIPLDKRVFVYGGNIGKPQGVSYIIKCLRSQLNNSKAYFLIIGDGTEFNRLKWFFDEYHPCNMKLMQKLPKQDYDRMIAACDVGMIFLDYRFVIPNFPSRMLSYQQAGIPVLACTDSNTDIGKVIVEGGFGWWCESKNVKMFCDAVNKICEIDIEELGERSYQYLCNHYTVDKAYNIIMK